MGEGEVRSAVGEVTGIQKLPRTSMYCHSGRQFQVRTKVPTKILNQNGTTEDVMQVLYFRELPDIRVGDKVRITIQIGENV